ncbi:MAG: SulP family inorganic anion transporter [Candidatus Omnitrophica bacterium]|nr:SulP family inorganic anion transporter [Candidatus Omnitrophota bacterium]
MNGTEKQFRNKRFPLFQGILPIKKSDISTEVMAGITLAALAIPEVMGYTKIAGTPVVTGLYTLLIPMFLYAIFGSSRHLVVAADSATAAILAAGLVSVAKGSHEYVALAGVLALMSAGLLIFARVVGLGFMADFLSRTVLIGFLTGVGFSVALGEVPGMLGITGGGVDLVHKITNDLQQISQINFYDLAISMIVIGVILGSQKFSKKIPGAFMAVVGAVVVSWLFDFKKHGVHTLGDVPQGLPVIGLPNVHWSFALVLQMLPTAFSMFVVILAQSAATSRAYAARYNESFNENIDLLGLGLANVGAALSSTFVVNGSPTKTEMVDSAGGRSQLSSIVTSLVVLLVLLFFTDLLTNMPSAVLSAVVFLIGLQLVDIQGMRKVWRQRQPEFWVALVTAVVVVLVGVEQGIVIAMVLSLMEHVRRSYRSQNVVLAIDKSTGTWRIFPVTEPQQVKPGLLLYRFAHTIYYANAQQLFDQVIGFVEGAEPPLSCLCIDASAVADVDFSAAETLREIFCILRARGVRLVWANVIDSVKAELDKYEIPKLMGEDAFFQNISDVVDFYLKDKKPK